MVWTVRSGLRLLAASAGLLTALVVALAMAGPAVAHTGLADASPEDGQTLDAAPERVVLTFTEELQTPAWLVVTSPSGEQLTSGEAEVDQAQVSAEITSDEPGDYRVAYRVVSKDGHPVTGSYEFTVAGGEGANESPSTDADPEPGAPEPGQDEPGYWEEHGAHTAWAAGLVAVAAALLLFEWRRRR